MWPVQGPYGRSFQVTIAEQLDAGLKGIEDRKEWATLEFPFLLNRVGSEATAAFLPERDRPRRPVRIAGIGRGRIATLQLAGPSIETTDFDVRTWPGAPIRLPARRNPRSYTPLDGLRGDVSTSPGPTRPIEGVVRDRETGRPLADILVYAGRSSARQASTVRTITGADGRYRLVGLPLGGREGELVAAPACDLSAGRNWLGIDPRLPADRCPPYFQAVASVPKSPGKEPVHLDIALNRGVRVIGRILDKDTGMPVSGRVAYIAFDDNPHRNSTGSRPAVEPPFHRTSTGSSGWSSLPVPEYSPPTSSVHTCAVPGSRSSTAGDRTGFRMSAAGSGSPMNSTRSGGSNRRRMPLYVAQVSWSSPVADDLEPGVAAGDVRRSARLSGVKAWHSWVFFGVPLLPGP